MRKLKKIWKRLTIPRRTLPDGKKAIIIVFHDYEREYANPQHGQHADKALRHLLETEQQQGITATYNIVGKICESHPETIKRILKKGHEIASHTYAHITPSTVDAKAFAEDVDSFAKAYKKATGKKVKGFRSPESGWTKEMLPVLVEKGYTWNAEADVHDQPYTLRTAAGIILRIPVLYDDWPYQEPGISAKEMLAELRQVIARAKKRGSIGGIGFHPWVQGMTDERLKTFNTFLEELARDDEVLTIPFGEAAKRYT